MIFVKINFRVWDKEKNQFLKNTREPRDDNLFIEYLRDDYCITHWDNTEINLYTGLKDKNNNKIYEGDIIQANGMSNNLIIFKNGGFNLQGGDMSLNLKEQLEYYGNYKVIGNKYENQDLLE